MNLNVTLSDLRSRGALDVHVVEGQPISARFGGSVEQTSVVADADAMRAYLDDNLAPQKLEEFATLKRVAALSAVPDARTRVSAHETPTGLALHLRFLS